MSILCLSSSNRRIFSSNSDFIESNSISFSLWNVRNSLYLKLAMSTKFWISFLLFKYLIEWFCHRYHVKKHFLFWSAMVKKIWHDVGLMRKINDTKTEVLRGDIGKCLKRMHLTTCLEKIISHAYVKNGSMYPMYIRKRGDARSQFFSH